MSDYERDELAAAIALMLETIRPNTMQNRVLEALINRQANGTPKMTYDLDVANREFAKSPLDIEIPSVWELIALDIAPSPNFWENVQYASHQAGAVRNAVYNLREQFEGLATPEDSISLYVFNKFGTQNKNINVVTLIHDYEGAALKCRAKNNNLVIGKVKRNVHRLRVQGKADCNIVNELASVFNEARENAMLPRGLGDELKRLEKKR